MNIKEVVNDPEWQALRVSFLGTWKIRPAQNILTLRQYLGDFNDPLKVRRVHNYLTGTAFRTRTLSHPDIDALLVEIRANRYNREESNAAMTGEA